MNTLTSLINTQISQKELVLKPNRTGAVFTVHVTNNSEQFASCQLEILAAGAESKQQNDWWTISPEVSSKKPPGDTTEFQVTILKSPLPGFVGLVNLTVRIFSIELQVEDRHIIRLTVESDGTTALKGELPVAHFQTTPGSSLEIPLRLLNPSKGTVQAQVNLLGLPPAWQLATESQKSVQLLSQQWHQIELTVELPSLSSHSPSLHSRNYPFQVQVTPNQGIPITLEGEIEVLPMGMVQFQVAPPQQRVPVLSKPFRLSQLWPQLEVPPASYTLAFKNQSNIPQTVSVKILKYQREEDRKACQLEIVPSQDQVAPQETQSLELIARPRRPWLGWSKVLLLELSGVISDERVELEDANQTVELEVFTIIPRWWQGVLAFLVVLCLWWLWGFKMALREHSAAVNVVRLNGLGDWVLSGSNDQTVRRWGVDQGTHLDSLGVFTATGKAVRALQYRPVDNNVMALGLENGEIQLWPLLGQQRTPTSLVFRLDDRVMDLEFTQDSRRLLSGHGSGLVLVWSLEGGLTGVESSQPLQQEQFDFAIYDMALVGAGDSRVAIAGRYNQLVLWDLDENKTQKIDYPVGGQDDYITSLAVPGEYPFLLATADNQGRITVWNMQDCLRTGQGNCTVIDQWQEKNEQAVRALAMSGDGCYLASAGDDGRVMLWVLTESGRRAGKYITGDVVTQQRTKINAVDLLVIEDKIVVVMGDDRGKVRLYHQKRDRANCRTSS